MSSLSRRDFLTGLGAGALVAALPRQLFAAEAGKRPNVVLIYTDDHDLNEIGCYGGKVWTPHMDSLAKDGMKFTRYYVSSPVCCPSRYNVLSGRYASRALSLQEKFPTTGYPNLGWESVVFGEKNTLAHRLQAAGYTTGMVGNWHQGLSQKLAVFDENADPNDPAVRKLLRANYDTTVASITSTGFDYVAAAYASNVGDAAKDGRTWLPGALRCHNQEWITQGALDFIEMSKDQPFFLYLALTGPHGPSPVESMTKYDPRATPLGLLDAAPKCQPSRPDALARAKKKGVTGPLAGLTWLDDGVGAVLKKLDALGLRDNTLVMLASDNGNGAKMSCYDGGARLPFVARWPGVIPAGSVCHRLVSNVDIPVTILDLCGGQPAAATPMDGVNILPALKGDASYRRPSLFLEITMERAVVTGDNWKYIAVRMPENLRAGFAEKKLNRWGKSLDDHTYGATKYPGYFDADQLYDLKSDPNEQKNLAADPQHQERLDQLKALLRDYSAKLPHVYGEFTTPRP